MKEKKYTIQSIPIEKRIVADIADLNRYVNLMHSFFQIDISSIRQKIKSHKLATGKNISILSCLLFCFSRTLDKHKDTIVLRSGRNKLFHFEEADVFFPFEINQDGQKMLWYKVIRKTNKKSVFELDHDLKCLLNIRKVFTKTERIFMKLPSFLRRIYYHSMMIHPNSRKQNVGNVYFSSTIHNSSKNNTVAYGLPTHFHSVGMFIGTFSGLSNETNGKSGINMLGITISLDHLISDGPSLAKLIKTFLWEVENFSLIES